MQADTRLRLPRRDRRPHRLRLVGGRKTLHFQAARPTGPPVAGSTVGEDLTAFSVRASALHPATPTVRGWSPKTEAGGHRRRRHLGDRVPTADLVRPVPSGAKRRCRPPNTTVSTRGHAAVTRRRPEMLADRLVNRWTAGAVTAKGMLRGRTRDRARVDRWTIADAGPASRHLPRHRGRAHLLRRVVSRPVSPQAIDGPSGLVDMLAGEPAARASAGTDWWSASSPRSATPQGSAGDVKVKYTALGDQVESNWARVVTVGGGTQRGMTFLPGDQRRGDRRVRGWRRPPAGGARRAVQRQGRRRSSSACTNSNGQQAPDHLPARAISSSSATAPHPTSQHIELSLAGGTALGAAGQGQARPRSVPAGIPVTITAGNSEHRDRQRRVDHHRGHEDHPQSRDRRGDLGG